MTKNIDWTFVAKRASAQLEYARARYDVPLRPTREYVLAAVSRVIDEWRGKLTTSECLSAVCRAGIDFMNDDAAGRN